MADSLRYVNSQRLSRRALPLPWYLIRENRFIVVTMLYTRVLLIRPNKSTRNPPTIDHLQTKPIHLTTAPVPKAESRYIVGKLVRGMRKGRQALTSILQSRICAAASQSVNGARAVDPCSPNAEHVALAHSKPIIRPCPDNVLLFNAPTESLCKLRDADCKKKSISLTLRALKKLLCRV